MQSEVGTESDQDVQSLHSMQIDILPITVDQMRTATMYDPILSQVLKFMLEGWPSQVSPELQPFFTCRGELTTMDGCLLWGMSDSSSQAQKTSVRRIAHRTPWDSSHEVLS